MRKTLSKVLAFAMAMVMVVGLLPATALAAGTETKADDLIHLTVFTNTTYTTAAYNYDDAMVKADGSTQSLKVDTTSNVHLCWDLRKEEGGMLDLSNSTLGAYFYFADGKPYAEAQIYDTTWASGRLAFTFEDAGDGWYYGSVKTNAGLSIDPAKAILLRLWFNKGTTVYIDGLKCEKLVDRNDLFAGGSQLGGSSWTTGTNMTFVNNCTETYGDDSLFAWKFSATAANNNQWAQFLMGMTQAYNMDGYYLVFDAKVDGVASQNMNIRPRTGADGSGDPCNNTTVKLTQGWNTYTVDFAAALKSTSTAADLTTVQRLFLVFDFAATTGAERSVIIDNVRLVSKVCQHANTTTTTVDATCTQAGSVIVTCDACGETVSTETIPASGHNYQSVVTAPTPSAQGYTTHTCSCGDSYVDSYTSYEAEGSLTLSENLNVNMSLKQDLYIDLNGYNLTGTINTNGCKVYGMDSATNDYSADNMGIFSCVDAEGNAIVPQQFYNTDDAKYMTIAGEGGYSFHRYYVGITAVSLAPSVTGFGYKAAFFGDAMVQAQVKSVGYDLWLTEDIVVSRNAAFNNSLTLRLKNFDASNYGNTPVNAKATMTLVDGTVLEGSVQSWSLQQMVETINADSTAYSADQLAAVKAMIEANAVMLNWQVENLLKESRGQAFTAGKDTYFDLEDGVYDLLSFDYKTEGVGELALIIRGSQWTKYFGDYRLTESGEKVDYAGITTELLEDGYIHVVVDLAALDRSGCVNNRDNAPSDVGLIDIFQWTTVNGYIDNIQLSNKPVEEVIRGQAFTAGKDTYFDLEDGVYDLLSFDYKTEGVGELALIIRGSQWTKYFGDYRLTESGEKVDYAGITTELLEDGYIHVVVDLAALDRSGCVNNRDNAPSDVGLIDIFQWTTVNGYIDNIQLSNKPVEEVIRGEFFQNGVTKTTYMEIVAQNNLTFDYKLATEGDMHVILRAPDWNGFYGDFEFTANGEMVDYDGITTEQLEDGYIRVTVVFSKLTRSGCVNNRDSAPASVGIFDIYSWGTANGYVDNIQVDVQIEEEPEIPAVPAETTSFEAGKGVTTGIPTAYETVSFDYQLTTDGVIGVILRDADAWLTFYGEFYFNANGETVDYAGITTQVLGNGYVRVTMNLAELTRSGCADNRNGAPEKVGVLDIYGGFSTASGNFGNVTVDP